MNIIHPFMRRWLSLLFVFMLSACGGGGGDGDTGVNSENDAVMMANGSVSGNVFVAALSTEQGAPLINSTATGIGIVLIDPASRLMRATLTTAGLSGISVHIQRSPLGSVPAEFSLTETPAGSGIWSVETTLTEEQFTTLQNENFYFSVRAIAFPQGELNAQILSHASGIAQINSIDGTGRFVSVDNNGGFAIGSRVTTNADNPGITNREPIGILNNIPFAPPTGTAIRDRIPISDQVSFVNVLTGAQQIPANASNAIAVGVAIVDPFNLTMVTSITSLGIAGLSAHIHQAPAGSNGDMIFPLHETALGSGIWASQLAISAVQLNAFAEENYYFDIHTAAFPNGEIRGQIAAIDATDGFTTGTNGIIQTPFLPGFITGSDNTGSVGASVPSFGNPVGSGIGSAGSPSFTGSVPSLGNPAGSGIGSADSPSFTGSAPSLGIPVGSGIGSDTGTGFIGSSGAFTNNMFGNQ